jgi:hypothetical protein
MIVIGKEVDMEACGMYWRDDKNYTEFYLEKLRKE